MDGQEGQEQQEWYREGVVQQHVLDFMQNQEEFTILSPGQVGGEQGVEIVAERTVDGRSVHRLVSVRGWPSQTYTRGSMAGQPRTTRPEVIANGWVAQAVLDLALSRGADPDLDLALALPTMASYIRYLQRLRWFLSAARVSVYLVSQEGKVAVTPPGAAPVNVFVPPATSTAFSGKRRKLGLPGATRLQLPLLHALVVLGGTASRSDAISTVAQWFPEVTQPPPLEFGQRLSIAQNTLQEEGLTEAAGRGVWTITDAGRTAHDTQWEEWLQKFKSNASEGE
jgi:hypothetical protein